MGKVKKFVGKPLVESEDPFADCSTSPTIGAGASSDLLTSEEDGELIVYRGSAANSTASSLYGDDRTSSPSSGYSTPLSNELGRVFAEAYDATMAGLELQTPYETGLDEEKVKALQDRLRAATHGEQIAESRSLQQLLRYGLDTCSLEMNGTLVGSLKAEPCAPPNKISSTKRRNHLFYRLTKMDTDGYTVLPLVTSHIFTVNTSVAVLNTAIKEIDVARLEAAQAVMSGDGTNGLDHTHPADEATAPAQPDVTTVLAAMTLPDPATGKEGPGDADETAELLGQLGYSKAFDATVVEVGPDYAVVSMRYMTSADKVAEALDDKNYDWAITVGLNAATYRRQMNAIKKLSMLVDRDNTQERLMRNILIETDPAVAQRLAAAALPWMDPEQAAEEELRLAVQADGRLNQQQREVILQALKRTVTLIEGPPGTGKTSTLIGLVKALSSVFHVRNDASSTSAALGFGIPSRSKVQTWVNQKASFVMDWANSIQDELLRQCAVNVLQDVTGRKLATMKKALWEAELTIAVEDGSLQLPPGSPDIGTLAQMLYNLKERLVAECDSGSNKTAFWRNQNRDMRMVVCAESNTAVDNLMMKLYHDEDFRKWDISVIRVGSALQMPAELEGWSLDSKIDEHALLKIHDKLKDLMVKKAVSIGNSQEIAAEITAVALKIERTAVGDSVDSSTMSDINIATKVPKRSWHKDELLKLARNLRALSVDLQDAVKKWLGKNKGSQEARKSIRDEGYKELRNRRQQLLDIAKFEVLLNAEIIFGTCIAIGEVSYVTNERAKGFPLVVMDEGAMCTEMSSIVPLVEGAEWLCAAGDLNQLRPVVISRRAKQLLTYTMNTPKAYGGSLFGRLHRVLGIPQLTLIHQYRMHPLLRDFPSRIWYQGALTEDAAWLERTDLSMPHKYFDWPAKKFPIAFLDHNEYDAAGANSKGSETSWHNVYEQSIALRVMWQLAHDATLKKVCIITPYKSQAKAIMGKMAAFRRQLALQGRPSFECGAYSVDAFQGQEADVIIYSAVRSNEQLRAGHTLDDGRLNVALTRAKRGLVIIGNERTLTSQSHSNGYDGRNHWPMLVEHIRKHGGFVDMKRVHLHALPCLPEALCVTDDDVAACRRLAGLSQAALSKAICRLQRSNTLCMNVPDLLQILERIVQER